jgi:hypothetical protein
MNPLRYGEGFDDARQDMLFLAMPIHGRARCSSTSGVFIGCTTRGAHNREKDPANTPKPTHAFPGVSLGGLSWVGLRPKWLRGPATLRICSSFRLVARWRHDFRIARFHLCRDSKSSAHAPLEPGGTDGSYQHPDERMAAVIVPFLHLRTLPGPRRVFACLGNHMPISQPKSEPWAPHEPASASSSSLGGM